MLLLLLLHNGTFAAAALDSVCRAVIQTETCGAATGKTSTRVEMGGVDCDE